MTSIPGPLSFLDAVTGVVEAGRTSSADRPIRLAVVDPAYDPFAGYPAATPPARVTFEGETILSAKAYPLTQGFVPRPGQRVWMVPQGNGYLVAGAVNSQTPQGFWQDPDGVEAGVELGGGNYFDTTDGLYLETDATFAGEVIMGGRSVATVAPTLEGKLHWGMYSVTTNASGFGTITHGAGFTPTFVLAAQHGSSGSAGVHVLYVTSTATATTFQVKVLLTTGAVYTGSVGIAAILAA